MEILWVWTGVRARLRRSVASSLLGKPPRRVSDLPEMEYWAERRDWERVWMARQAE